MSDRENMKKTTITAIVISITLAILTSGCGDKFFDPRQIGRFRPVPAVNVILDSLGVADEDSSQWDSAEDPKPIDVMVFENDYSFSPGDIVRISIYELLQETVNYVDTFVVTETGKISLPEIGIIEVVGLTESQVEEEIRQILSPSILKDPLVTVISLSSERRSYSILGNGVGNAGRYPIPRHDYRLNDALATAQVATQFNISYVYVSRNVTGNEIAYGQQGQTPQQNDQPAGIQTDDSEMLEIIAPRAQVNRHGSQLVITTSEMNTDLDFTGLADSDEFGVSGNNNAVDQANTQIEWVFKDGKWVPIQVGPQAQKRIVPEQFDEPTAAQAGKKQIPEQFDWDQVGTGGVQTRVIKIPTDKLASGDPRYNIVIRPGDTIQVPVDVIGEFAIMGNVNNIGYITLSGRRMTLKMAIAAGGGLGPFAWPKRVEVTRRIGKNKEETVMVDLDKIASGEEPDFFIKPNDLINVGTHPTSIWRAVLRNSFRATYGFGFVYDRNFGNLDAGKPWPPAGWF